jgi:hypothetical protein
MGLNSGLGCLRLRRHNRYATRIASSTTTTTPTAIPTIAPTPRPPLEFWAVGAGTAPAVLVPGIKVVTSGEDGDVAAAPVGADVWYITVVESGAEAWVAVAWDGVGKTTPTPTAVHRTCQHNA